MRVFRIPLAWKNLTHDRRRLSAAVGGIAFAVILMFMQKGFENALIDSTVEIIHKLNGEIVIVSRAQYALPAQQRFDVRRLYDARGVVGVEAVYPLYIETYAATLKTAGEKGYPIRVLGVDPGDPVLDIPSYTRQAEQLRAPRTALIDVKTKDKFKVPVREPNELPRHRVELSDKSVTLVGNFELGTDFANDGNLIMSTDNFASYFPYRVQGGDPLGQVDVGVVRVEPGADPEQVKRRLRARLAGDVEVFTKQEFLENETGFWRSSTPIGFIFGFGTVMGFVVGVIICYQIIYANIADHMGEFATLKAMGYTHLYFISLVISESFYLSLFGFIPGLVISILLYALLASVTGLLLNLTVLLALMIYLLTLAMCVVSGILALRKVLAADPAELF